MFALVTTDEPTYLKSSGMTIYFDITSECKPSNDRHPRTQNRKISHSSHPRAKRQRYAQSELRHFRGYESFLPGVLVVPNDNKAHPILISKRRRRKKIFVAPPKVDAFRSLRVP